MFTTKKPVPAPTGTRLKGVRNPPPIHRRPPKPFLGCPTPGCPAPEVVDDDGKRVCTGCGVVVSEANIVNEVQFGESSAGAAVLQGTYVGADQSHARTTSGPFKRGEGMDSREVRDANGLSKSSNCTRVTLTSCYNSREALHQSVGCSVAHPAVHRRHGFPGLQARNVPQLCSRTPNQERRCRRTLHRLQKAETKQRHVDRLL